MLGRLVAITGAPLLVLAGWAWLRAETDLPSPAFPPSSTAAHYAAEVSAAVTTIHLPEDFDQGCDLIVSSLGDPDSNFQVRLSHGTVPAHAPAALREIALIRPKRTREKILPLQRDDSGAPSPSVSTTSAPTVAANARTFDLHVGDTPLEDPRGYVRVMATVVAEGRDVRVYTDTRVTPGEIASGLIEEIIHLLDERIIPRSRAFLGTHADIDGDGKLAVLLTPWLGKLQGGRTSVNGFVRSSDFQPFAAAPYSNRADVLYLNSALRPGTELAALLAHEYTHAVCCSLRGPDSGRPPGYPQEADWLNEAIAHVAERMHEAGWSNLDRRVQSFLENPQETPLVVRDYYRAGLWRDPACRGATFLFLQWCADCFGQSLLRELVNNPQTGIENIEAVTGQSFATLYRQWTLALREGALPSLSLHGQLGNCTLAGPHCQEWRPSQGALDVGLRGTATAFIHCVFPKTGDSPRRIVLDAPREAHLQVTLARFSGAPQSEVDR